MRRPLTWGGSAVPSPGGRYVAVVGAGQEVWGRYVAGLALWAAGGPLWPPHLLYYRADHVAHALAAPQTGQPIFLYWSQAGDWLSFYEVKRQQTYQVVFIEVAAGQVYRVAATDELLLQLPTLSRSGPPLAAFLQQVAHSVGPLLRAAVPAELRLR